MILSHFAGSSGRQDTPASKTSPDSNNTSGANLLDLPKDMNPAALQKRPSIAPVPAFLEGSGIDIQVINGQCAVFVKTGKINWHVDTD